LAQTATTPKKHVKTSARVAINTAIIYVQKFSSAALALITTPLLLRVLGVSDFGIYALTTGFVGAVTFFTWSVSSATQRFIALALGEKNDAKLKQVISSSMFIHLVYGVIIFLAIVLVNYFFSAQLLNIPPDRQEAASKIIVIVAGISFLNIIGIPFLGVLRAHENFFILAVAGVTESLCKLAIAFLLLFLKGDLLLQYSLLMLLVSLISFFIYSITVHKKYYKINADLIQPHTPTIKNMMAFIGWTLLGALAVMSRNQGVAVVLNMFFGVITNAAYGVALQINYAINILAQGVTGALTPVLLKSAGEKNYDKMLYSMKTMSRMAFYSIAVVSLPLYFSMEKVLFLWLKNVPDGTVVFARCTIILVLVCILSSGMQAVFDAIGKVKIYNILVSVLLILNLPIAYLFFKLGYPDYTILLVSISLECLSYFLRLYLLGKYVNFSGIQYLRETVKEIGIPVLTVCVVLYAITLLPINGLLQLVFITGSAIVIFPLLVYRFSLDVAQKQFVNNIFTTLKSKLY
jgi:O-antigen/teichoic acid export membrane protein